MKTNKNSGFTRADLMTIVAVVATMALLAAPSLARVTARNTIAQCAANLQRNVLALEIYGNENQDLLPSGSGGSWVWDASSAVLGDLTNNGASFLTLYCPGTAPRFTEADNLNLFHYVQGSYGVLGYALTLPGTAGFSPADGWQYGTNANVSFTEQRIAFSGNYLPVAAATRPLMADATVCQDPLNIPTSTSLLAAAEQTYNWVQVVGGYQKHQLAPHLNGQVPLGGNVGMLDGHIEWRPLANMQPRAGGAGNPVFFW